VSPCQLAHSILNVITVIHPLVTVSPCHPVPSMVFPLVTMSPCPRVPSIQTPPKLFPQFPIRNSCGCHNCHRLVGTRLRSVLVICACHLAHVSPKFIFSRHCHNYHNHAHYFYYSYCLEERKLAREKIIREIFPTEKLACLL